MYNLTQLVVDAKSGERDAFGELYKRYRKSVYLVIKRFVYNKSDARELCHDVFVKAMQKIDQLERPERFKSWLCMIANRTAQDHLDCRHNVPVDPDYLCETLIEGESPLANVVATERKEILNAALSELTHIDREVLKLRYYSDLPLSDIAKLIGRPLGTVKRRLHVARKRLLERLHDRLN